MSWQVGPFIFAPNATATFTISWNGAYMGPQYMIARPAPGFSFVPLWLDTTSYGMEHAPNDRWRYKLTIREMYGRSTLGVIVGGEVP